MGKGKLDPRIKEAIEGRIKPIEGSKEKCADLNIAQLVQDVDLERITYHRDISKDKRDGRFTYQLSHEEKEIQVEMPGLPLERVRYLRKEKKESCDFPQLRVDESSWTWDFAVEVIRYKFSDAYQKSELYFKR
jgi:hypothetical protein